MSSSEDATLPPEQSFQTRDEEATLPPTPQPCDGSEALTVPPLNGPAENLYPTQASEHAGHRKGSSQALDDASETLSGSATKAAAQEWPRLAGYEILGELGRGGMGVVYKARHQALNRVVALKMVLGGGFADAGSLARFQAEAEAVAGLQHPGIVQVYEVGNHDGLPYISLEFVAGGSLAHKLERTPQPALDAASVLEKIARAMAHAHEHGIVHRDLKPQNILLAISDHVSGGSKDGKGSEPKPESRPLTAFTPKITDFGLAKRVEGGSGLTQTGAVLGTPSYMAPEQAQGKGKEVGPPADIYALGAILYDMLTGRPPFQGPTPLDTVLQVISTEPVPPSQLMPRVPRDLETICLKCLQKEPSKRYASARDLADDLQRFCQGDPIQARPVGRVERTWRWCRKNKALAAAAVLIPLALVAGTIVSLIFGIAATESATLAKEAEGRAQDNARKAADNARQAGKSEREARDSLATVEALKRERSYVAYATSIPLARSEWNDGDSRRAKQLLEDAPVEARGWEWYFLKDLFQERSRTLSGHAQGVYAVACGGQNRAATLGRDSSVRLWNLRTGAEIAHLPGMHASARLLALSPDGRLLAVNAVDQVQVYEAASGRSVARFLPFPVLQPCAGLGFVRAGKELAVCSQDGQVKFFDTSTWRELRHATQKLKLDSQTAAVRDQVAQGVTFSPDGSFVGQGGVDLKVRVWDAVTGERLLEGKGHRELVGAVAFSPDGKRAASCGGEGTIRIWDLASKQMVQQLRGHRGLIFAVAFTPDGKRLVSCSRDKTVRIFDLSTGETIETLRGHNNDLNGLALTPDGRYVVAVSQATSEVRVWDIGEERTHLALPVRKKENQDNRQPPGPGAHAYFGHLSPAGASVLSPDSKYLATAGWGDGTSPYQVVIWRLADHKPMHLLKVRRDRMYRPAFSPDGKYLAVGVGGGGTPDPAEVFFFDLASGKELWRWKEMPVLETTPTFLPDGKSLVVTCAVGPKGNLLVKLDAQTHNEMFRERLPHTLLRASLTPEGDLVTATAKQSESHIEIRDPNTGKIRKTWLIPRVGITDLECSSKGVIAAARVDGSIRLWRAADGQVLRDLHGHAGLVLRLAFSPNGRRLASFGQDASVRVWDVEGGRELLSFRDHATFGRDVSWSGDGKLLAAACNDGAVRVWRSPIAGKTDTSAWTELFRDDFENRTEPGVHWFAADESHWTIRDGVLVGTQVRQRLVGNTLKKAKTADAFPVTQVTLAAVELPTIFEVHYRFRVLKPMTVNTVLLNANYGSGLGPMIIGGNFPSALEGIVLFHVGRGLSFSVAGVQRKFELEPGRWYDVRLLRESTLLRFIVDGVERLAEPIADEDLPRLLLQGAWGEVGDEIEFDDVAVRAPAAALEEQKLRKRILEVFAETHLHDETRRRIEAATRLSTTERMLLDRVLESRPEDPVKIEEACRSTIERPNASPAEYGLAARRAEALVRIQPGNPHFLAVLALARLRTGRLADAEKNIQQAIELARAETGTDSPFHLAIRAMIQFKAGQNEPALASYRAMNDLLLSDFWAKNELVQRFRRETQDTLGKVLSNASIDADGKTIKQMLTRSLQEGWHKHDLNAYLAAFAADASVRSGRGETPEPTDIVLNREQLAACRRIEFRAPATKNVGLTCQDWQVTIKADTAVARFSSTAHLWRNAFFIHGEEVLLKKAPAGWHITAWRSWPILERTPEGRLRHYDAKEWSDLDETVAKLDARTPLVARLQALQEALRFAEADKLLKERPVTAGGSAALWCEKGKIAFALGRVAEACAAFRQAEQKDPDLALPWYMTRQRHLYAPNVLALGIALHPDGKHIASTAIDAKVIVREIATGKTRHAFDTCDKSTGLSVAYSPDGTRLAAADAVGVQVWDVLSGKRLSECRGPTDAIYRVAFSPDGAKVIGASADHTARVWDAVTGKELLKLEHKDSVLAALFSPDGRTIATASADKTACLWDAATGKLLHTFTGHSAMLTRVAFSPDGQWLATTGYDRTARIWNVKSHRLQAVIRTGSAQAQVVLFGPDGARLATADEGGSISIWDWKSRRKRLRLAGLTRQVFALDWSRDGRTLASAGADGVVLWDVTEERLPPGPSIGR